MRSPSEISELVAPAVTDAPPGVGSATDTPATVARTTDTPPPTVPPGATRVAAESVIQDGRETFVLNLGPQHPATHGVLRVKLTMDGEFVNRAEPVCGYIHRMQEKMAENRS